MNSAWVKVFKVVFLNIKVNYTYIYMCAITMVWLSISLADTITSVYTSIIYIYFGLIVQL